MYTNINVPYFMVNVCQQLNKAGYEAFIVGGAVRDFLLGRENFDFDITTSALPDEILSVFPDARTFGSYGTMVINRENMMIEITPFRNDAPGRKPDYSFGGTLYTDLARRDFTINSMAYDPLKEELIDPFGGLNDLENKIIRCTGSTIRIWEDPLRAMRAARFQAQLGFTIDPSTLYALKSRSPELDTISRERIRDELVKLITGEFAFDGLITLVVTGLMNNIIPELMKGMGLFHCNKPIDVLEHNLITCKMVKNTMLLRITALLHDIGKPFSVLQTEKGLKFPNHHIKSAQIAEKVLMDLRFSRHTINKAVTLIQNHMFRYPLDSSLPDARRLISKVGWDNIYDLIEIRKADRLASGFESAIGKETAKLIQHLEIIKDENSSYRIKDLAIDGDDLINNYHLPPGPHIKEILTKLLDMVIENPKLNKKEVLLDIVREKLLRKLGDTCKHL